MAIASFPTMPSVDLSGFDVSKIQLPRFDLPTIDSEAVASAAKDAAYVTVGLAVLGLQKLQVRRRELARSIGRDTHVGRSPIGDLVGAVEARLASIDSRLESLEDKLDTAIVDLERRLPERAGVVLGQAHDLAKVARQQLRSLVVA
ncbi:unannotated protein [freshwater metagenome]|uniref:Unannotated protein n=1 Tax=freshwater metagenome TaxID=449393 RepID=A0A6J7EIY3_9ZZZZ|nr:hypothetical protein [Actinomycetota bacterium]